jgi:hypothetical protein
MSVLIILVSTTIGTTKIVREGFTLIMPTSMLWQGKGWEIGSHGCNPSLFAIDLSDEEVSIIV